jgi:tetratricopeptide (TPR) repeat protein
VSINRAVQLLLALCLISSATHADDSQTQQLNRQFQSAVALYDSGHFPEAAQQLEALLPLLPKSFEVHELLGQVYASESQDSKAIAHLQIAVALKPDSGPARTNLGASLFRIGQTQQAGEQFRRALELQPKDYDANHNLGEFYIQSDKIQQALPLLQTAQKINPNSYDNGYDLAMANFETGHLSEARQSVESLLEKKDTAELHNLLAKIEERVGKYVAAATQFQLAAHLDPSDDNLFDWGSELLLHRTLEPAIDVFREASHRYPNSPRLLIGLGMALYSRGMYEDAIKALLAAADLTPSDPRCYVFLSRAYDSSPNQAGEVIERFRRYAQLQPANALAQYYYAMSLWKGKRAEDAGLDIHGIESLLKRAIELDDKLAEPHMQLGNLYADQHQYEKSVPEYVQALQLDPNLADAHYRLGTDYVHIGQKDRAQEEFAIYQKLRSQHLTEVDKERAEVQQFVYSAKSGSSAKP